MTLTLVASRDLLAEFGMLPVNEMFETIQGEGFHAGRPAVFIRMQGCPVGCPWCDTKFTWERHGNREVTSGEMLTKDHSGDDRWAALGPVQLGDLMTQYRARHVVLTGGEPAMHDLRGLSRTLIEDVGVSVQIETSGTYEVRCHPDTWVTVSPKLAMPGGLEVRDDALARADEIKMPVGRAEDIVVLLELLRREAVRANVPIYLQPLSLSRRATDLCVANAIANNWRVSLQIHALADWR